MTILTVARLRELFHYCCETGIFTRLVRTARGVQVGDIAGSLGRKYLYIRVDGKLYAAHRLAWLYMNGAWPRNFIDHIDGNPINNRFPNLRDVPANINSQNRKRANQNNRSGVLGVEIIGDRFRARCTQNGGVVHLGMFPSAAEAGAAVLAFKRTHHAGNTL